MTIAISEEHEILGQTVRRWLDAHCPPSVPRALLDAADEELQPVWKELAAQGWLGIHVPEEYGGQGFGLAELAVVLEQAGRSLVPGPLVPTVLAAAAVVECGHRRPARRPRSRAGRRQRDGGGVLRGRTARGVRPGRRTARSRFAAPCARCSARRWPPRHWCRQPGVTAPRCGAWWTWLPTAAWRGGGFVAEPLESLDPTRRVGALVATEARSPSPPIVSSRRCRPDGCASWPPSC